MKRFIASILACLFVMTCLIGCNGDAIQTETDAKTDAETNTDTTAVPDTAAETTEDIPEYRSGSDIVLPEYDTSEKIMKTTKTIKFKGNESLTDFALYSGGGADGSTVIMPARTVSGVYPLQPAPDDSESEYSFILNCASPSSEATWITFYLGLRLTDVAKDATDQTGVWIAMRSNQIGIRRGSWPADGYMKADWDLSKGERVTVIDDPVNNIIKVYAGEEKRAIAEIKIDGKKIGLYAPGADSPSVTDTLPQNVIKGGYSHLWNHHTPCQGTV
ncbi:MAG: hypothetical protein IKQ18_02110, partial [Clostridia bacterium]|nr:hypothetical protein [Clostridia bacterium]